MCPARTDAAQAYLSYMLRRRKNSDGEITDHEHLTMKAACNLLRQYFSGQIDCGDIKMSARYRQPAILTQTEVDKHGDKGKLS